MPTSYLYRWKISPSSQCGVAPTSQTLDMSNCNTADTCKMICWQLNNMVQCRSWVAHWIVDLCAAPKPNHLLMFSPHCNCRLFEGGCDGWEDVIKADLPLSVFPPHTAFNWCSAMQTMLHCWTAMKTYAVMHSIIALHCNVFNVFLGVE